MRAVLFPVSLLLNLFLSSYLLFSLDPSAPKPLHDEVLVPQAPFGRLGFEPLPEPLPPPSHLGKQGQQVLVPKDEENDKNDQLERSSNFEKREQGSCDPIYSDQENALVKHYGRDSVKLSRGYEGSGRRVREFLKKLEDEKAVKIGVLGGSGKDPRLMAIDLA
jgi:hypothetical protein